VGGDRFARCRGLARCARRGAGGEGPYRGQQLWLQGREHCVTTFMGLAPAGLQLFARTRSKLERQFPTAARQSLGVAFSPEFVVAGGEFPTLVPVTVDVLVVADGLDLSYLPRGGELLHAPQGKRLGSEAMHFLGDVVDQAAGTRVGRGLQSADHEAALRCIAK